VAGIHSPCLGDPRFKPKDWCRKYSLRFCVGAQTCARIPVSGRHSVPSRSAPKPNELLEQSILGDFWGERGLGVVVTTHLSLQPRVKMGCRYTVASPLHLQRRDMSWPLHLLAPEDNRYSIPRNANTCVLSCPRVIRCKIYRGYVKPRIIPKAIYSAFGKSLYTYATVCR
jgi:hypothetical protein